MVADRETEEDQKQKVVPSLRVKLVKCQRTGHTREHNKQHKQEDQKIKLTDNETRMNYEMKHNTDDAGRDRKSCFVDGEHRRKAYTRFFGRAVSRTDVSGNTVIVRCLATAPVPLEEIERRKRVARLCEDSALYGCSRGWLTRSCARDES